MEYRRKIKMKQKDYIDARQRATKSLIISDIIREVKAEGGRFLKQDEHDKLWYEVDDKEVKKKTSQTLREGAPQWRKSNGEWKRREEEMYMLDSFERDQLRGLMDVSSLEPSYFSETILKKPKLMGDERKQINGLDLLSDVALHSTREKLCMVPIHTVSASPTIISTSEGEEFEK